MPAPHLRTRSKRHTRVTLPGGREQIRYKNKIVPTSSCSLCGRPLAGISHLTIVKRHKLNRSKRRIWRPYGGELCHNCLKRKLKQSARAL